MANIDRGFRTDILSLQDITLIASGTNAPDAGGGFEAPQGSLYLKYDSATDGEVYVKFGPADVDWQRIATVADLTTGNTKQHLSRHNGPVIQTFTLPTTINFGTDLRTDSIFQHSLVAGGSEITVTQTGWYKISYEITMDASTNGRRTSTHWIQVNGANYPGTISKGYHRNLSDGKTTATATIKLPLGANDTIRVRSRGSSSVTTVENGCRLNIETIDNAVN